MANEGTAVPIPAVGEHFHDGLYVARCIIGYAATSASGSEGYDRWTDTQETIALFDINATDIIVHSLYRDVETEFTNSVTITIGDGANVAGFMASAVLIASDVSSGQIIEDTAANGEYLRGKWYKSTDSIDAVIGGADVAAGKMSVYVVYSHGGSLAVPDSGGSSNT